MYGLSGKKRSGKHFCFSERFSLPLQCYENVFRITSISTRSFTLSPFSISDRYHLYQSLEIVLCCGSEALHQSAACVRQGTVINRPCFFSYLYFLSPCQFLIAQIILECCMDLRWVWLYGSETNQSIR